MKHHLYRRKNVYYYNRRVPVEFVPYVGQRVVCMSLETDSLAQAIRLSGLKSAQLENYWNSLAATGRKHDQDLFLQTVKRAKLYGFTYIPVDQLATGCVDDLAHRVNFVADHNFKELPAAAVLGGVKKPEILLSDALEKFWHFKADVTLTKSENEVRKWRNPRRLAMDNFIKINGDIPIKKVARENMRRLKDWWRIRIIEDEYSPATANKDFRHVKSVVTCVAEECGFGFTNEEINNIFSGLEFNDDHYEPRKPFTSDFIINTLLAPQNLEGLHDYEIAMIKVFAETGVSVSEMVKLMPEDIRLNDPYPHLEIRPRSKMMLKTRHRERIMPLVGYALEAFKQFPNGFRMYVTNADSISTNINTHFRIDKEIYPSEKHSLYSLRHSFQDRLTNNKVDRRIQLDLMGHKYPGEKYGEGGWLKEVYEEVKKIQLKPE